MVQARLYGSPISTATARVRIALALEGIAFQFVQVDLRAQEHRGPAYLAKNPLGQVPTLEIDGVRLTQSIAICEYLHDTRPQSALLPADPVQRARCRELVEMINSGIQPLQNRGVLETIVARYGDDKLAAIFEGRAAPTDDSWPQHFIAKGLRAFEARLADTAGQYCIGDAVTLADVVLAPQVTACRTVYRVDLSPYPRLVAIHERLGQLPAFAAVRPPGG